MWTSIGTIFLKGVVEGVAGSLQNANEPRNSNSGNYNNVHGSAAYRSVSRSSGDQRAASSSWEFVDERTRCTNGSPQTTCRNCNNGKDTGGTAPRKQKDDNKFYMIKVPESGNIEIKIKKTESQLANMNIRSSNGSHKSNQKPSVSNTNQKKFDNKKQHNGNQNKEFNQKRSQNPASQFNGNKTGKNRENGTNLGKHNMGGQNSSNAKYNVKVQNGVSNVQKLSSSRSQKTWMYLGRLKVGTTEADIRSYLTEKFPGYEFRIESLPLYRDGKLPCFKVQVADCILDEFQQLEHWPNGVKITKYHNNFKK